MDSLLFLLLRGGGGGIGWFHKKKIPVHCPNKQSCTYRCTVARLEKLWTLFSYCSHKQILYGTWVRGIAFYIYQYIFTKELLIFILQANTIKKKMYINSRLWHLLSSYYTQASPIKRKCTLWSYSKSWLVLWTMFYAHPTCKSRMPDKSCWTRGKLHKNYLFHR